VFIEIEDLKSEPLHVHHVYSAGEIKFSQEDADLIEPITVDFVLEHKDSSLRIRGTVNTAVQLKCSRCAIDISRNIDSGFDLTYLPQPEWSDEDGEVELKYEDMGVALYDGVKFDVNLMVLEQIELAIPMKFVCREDCKGLCFQCGTDLNEGTCSCEKEPMDERLGVLLEFRKKMDP